MNPQNPNPSSPDSTTPPKLRKDYFELRLRIRYWWLVTALALLIVGYPIAVIYTGFSKQSYEAQHPQAKYEKQWQDTGCIAILKEQAKADHVDEWEVKRRWKHLLRLDDSYLALNNQAILEEPFCLGARVRHLVNTPGPWRYDIVDTKTQTIIVSVSITPGK